MSKPNDEQKPAEEVEGQEPEQTDEQGAHTPDTEQAGNEPEGNEGEQEKAEDGDSKLSHDDALKALTKTRGEAASWRTKYRELEKKLDGAKTPEEIEALVTEMKAESAAAEHALVVENVALKHKLDEDLTKILNDASAGKSREELEAHAATLAKYMPVEDEDPDLSGGLRPGSSDEEFDPYELAREARKARRR